MEGGMKAMINLLPPSFRREQILRRRIVQWASIISVVLATGWGWHWYEMLEDKKLTQQLDALSREHAPTQSMLKQLMEMRQQLVELQQQETLAQELDYQRNSLKLLGVISESARRTKGRLRINRFELNDFQGGSGENGAAGKPPGLVLGGTSLDNLSVAEAVDGLKSSGLFNRVDLLTAKEREDKEALLREYEVRCEF